MQKKSPVDPVAIAFKKYRKFSGTSYDSASELNDEKNLLWEDMWRAADFSWNGIADSGWELGTRANPAQLLKRWHAPQELRFGIDQNRQNWQQASLQDYWRWSKGVPGFENKNELLTDEQLSQAGLLVEENGIKWHKIHRYDIDIANDDILLRVVIDRLKCAEPNGAGLAETQCLLTGARCQSLAAVFLEWLDQTPRPYGNRGQIYLSAKLAEFNSFAASRLEISGNKSFEGARFTGSTKFRRARFLEATSFDYAYFTGHTDFKGAIFSGKVSFQNCWFRRSANFGDSVFEQKSEFIGSHFWDAARFEQASFENFVSFEKVSFEKYTDFADARFRGNARFMAAEFSGDVRFNTAEFLGKTNFSLCRFENSAEWWTAKFNDVADFTKSRWGVSVEGEKTKVHFGGAFYAATFRDIADFSSTHFYAFAAFDGALFEKSLLLKDPESAAEDNMMFLEASEAVRSAIHTQTVLEDRSFSHPSDTVDYWRELSSGFRTAKAAMEKQGDTERAQAYFRYEVKARLNRPTATLPEVLTGWLYDRLSDFGNSMVRPVIGVLSIWLVFATVYLVSGLVAIRNYGLLEMASDASSFSLLNILRPFYALGIVTSKNTLLTELIINAGPWNLLFLLLSSFQSLSAVILLFLFGLAVRRKFQMN